MGIENVQGLQQTGASESFAVDHAVPRVPAMTEMQQIERKLKDMGVDVDGMKAENQKEVAKSAGDRYRQVLDKANTESGKGGVVEGGLVALKDITRSAYNGILGLSDSLENYAAANGVGTGDILNESQKWDDHDDDRLDTAGKVSRAVVNFAAPLAAGLATGGGGLAALGAGAVYDFLAIDPKQPRISDALKDTFLKEIPVVSDIMAQLQHKPDDTEMDSRIKNVFEGSGVAVGLGGILWSASKTYSALKILKNGRTLSDAEKAAAKSSVENVALAPEAQVAAQEAQYGKAPEVVAPEVAAQNVTEADDMAKVLGVDQPGVVHADTGTQMNLADDQSLNTFYNAMQNNMNREMLLKPTTDKELANAALVMKNKPDVLKSLANYDPKAGSLTDEQTLVMKYLMRTADSEIGSSATKAITSLKDEDLVKFARDFENYARFVDIKQGTASAKGRALRAERVLGALAGLGDKEALAAIGAQGRAKLMAGLLDQYGGKDTVRKTAQNIQFISDVSRISKMSDSDFTSKMGQVVQYSKWNRVEDAVTKVALNGMLSSPMTPLKAAITNAATTSKTIVDNYLSAGIGAISRSADARSLAEANAHAQSSFAGLFEAVMPASKSILSGVPENTRTMRLDIAEAGKKFVPQIDNELMETAGGAWANKLGVVTDVLTAKELPRRVLMGVDSYWQHVNSKGVLTSEAVRDGMRRGLEGEAFAQHVEKFVNNPPARALQRADEIAATNTMAKQLSGWAEKLDDTLSGAPVPFVKVVLPFLKTNLNLIEYNIKNSPLAVFYPEVRDAIAAGGRDRDMALAKIVSGTSAVAGLTWLAHNGLVMGPDSENPELSRATKDNKHVPLETSIKGPDGKFYSLKGLEPLSTVVDIAALLNKSAGYISDGEHDDAVQATRAMLADVMTPEQLTTGLSDLLNVINGKDDVKGYLAQIATRFTPYGAAITDIRQTVDPTIRDTKAGKSMDAKAAGLKEFYETLKNRFSNQVPYFSKSLPASRNLWGEKLQMPDGLGPDSISPIATTDDKGLKMKQALERMDNYYELNKGVAMGLYKFDLKMPERIVKNPMADVYYQMNPKEYSAYLLINAGIDPLTGAKPMGMSLKEATFKTLNDFGALNKKPQDYKPEEYAALVGTLSKVFQMYRKRADGMIMQYGDVQRKMTEQAQKYMQFQETGGSNVGQ